MSQPFADFVMKNHPNSGYVLYAAIFQPRDERMKNPALAEQVVRFPNKSYTNQLRLVTSITSKQPTSSGVLMCARQRTRLRRR